MFSHTEEVMVFLFPFWEHLAYCGSTFLFSVLHGSQSKCLPQLTAGKGLWEPPPLLFCLSSSTTGKYEADPVYVCRNLKMSWYAVVIKEESRAVYPVEYRALNQKTPLGPPGRLWRALCFKMQGQDFCYWICSLHSGNRKVVRVVPL